MKLTVVTLLAATSQVGLCNNINGWLGCSNEAPDGKLSQKAQINQAYKDAVKLAGNIMPYRCPDHDTLVASSDYEYHEVADRFFGTVPEGGCSSDKEAFSTSVWRNAANWYPWWFFDYWWGQRISVRCTDFENRCVQEDDDGNKYYPTAYASNLDSGPAITFCDRFWTMDTLAAREKLVADNPSYQKDIKWFTNQGEVFLHEMMHLRVISGSKDIIDYIFDSGNFVRAYGPKLAERLARIASRDGSWDAHLNADSYAMLASGAWFQDSYGVPDSSLRPQEVDADPSTLDTDGGVLDAPINAGQWGNVAAYPASLGYEPDLAQVTDMVNYGKTALKIWGTDDKPMTAPPTPSAPPSTTLATSTTPTVKPPPVCTPNIECSDGKPNVCKCTGCKCDDGTSTYCNKDGGCGKNP